MGSFGEPSEGERDHARDDARLSPAEALERWRDAERRLGEVDPSSHDAESLRAEAAQFQEAYHQAYTDSADQLDDVPRPAQPN